VASACSGGRAGTWAWRVNSRILCSGRERGDVSVGRQHDLASAASAFYETCTSGTGPPFPGSAIPTVRALGLGIGLGLGLGLGGPWEWRTPGMADRNRTSGAGAGPAGAISGARVRISGGQPSSPSARITRGHLPISERAVRTCGKSERVGRYKRLPFDTEIVTGRLVRVPAIEFACDCVSEFAYRPLDRRKLADCDSA